MDDAFVGNILKEMTAAASATTGGMSGGGETVVTGDSSASVQVTNVIHATGDGGTSHTVIEKTINGVQEVAEETKDFAPGEPVVVETRVEAHAEGQTPDAATETATTSSESAAQASTTEETSSGSWNLSVMFSTVSGFFSSIFSWWSN